MHLTFTHPQITSRPVMKINFVSICLLLCIIVQPLVHAHPQYGLRPGILYDDQFVILESGSAFVVLADGSTLTLTPNQFEQHEDGSITVTDADALDAMIAAFSN